MVTATVAIQEVVHNNIIIRLWYLYLIFILCNFNLNPNNSDSTPDSADKITTFINVNRYGLSDKPAILNGLSNSCKQTK